MTAQEKNSWTDIILGSVFILFGAGIYAATLDLPGSTYDPLGPAFMPRALGICCVLCSVVIMYHGILKRSAAMKTRERAEKPPQTALFTRHPLTALAAMAFVFFYILALDLGVSGFRTLTVVFVLGLGGLLIKAERKGSAVKKGIVLSLLAVFLSMGLFYLFTQVFIVDLY